MSAPTKEEIEDAALAAAEIASMIVVVRLAGTDSMYMVDALGGVERMAHSLSATLSAFAD